jgi:YVTN family beta-propeller protein
MRHRDATRLLILVVAVLLPLQVAACDGGSTQPADAPGAPAVEAAKPSATPAAQSLPNMGTQITPLAPAGATFVGLNPGLADQPGWLAGQAVSTAVSPDRKTLLVLTSGYNRVYRTDAVNGVVPPDAMGTYFNWPDSMEYVFVYDISGNAPVQKQVVRVPNTYNGIAWDPSGKGFYVSSGVGDGPYASTGAVDPAASAGDNVHVYTPVASTGAWAQSDQLLLGHTSGNGLDVQPPAGMQPLQPNEVVGVGPCAAGVAVSDDGKTLVVANYYNDSISVFTGGLGHWSKSAELDLRPGKSDPADAGVPGGEYPFWVVIKGTGSGATAYISSIRDREVVVANVGPAPSVTARIAVAGQPNKMTLNKARTLLYVAEDQSDTVDVIDTKTNRILETIPVLATSSALPLALAPYKGANPNSVTLSPDERRLWVTLGNINAVAVIPLSGANVGDQPSGLIPTGWYPNSVSFNAAGTYAYVVNGKSPTGANPEWYYSYGPPTHKNGYAANEYNPQLVKAGLQTFRLPTRAQLVTLTSQVATNNHFSHTESASDAATMARVRAGVKHVIFIIKENRTYDQVLGDAKQGNGDPALAEFGLPLTPNLHRLAQTFVTLDNTYATAEVSYDGWLWSTAAQAPDVVEKEEPVMYAGRGLSLDGGTDRDVNVSLPTVKERQAANPLTPSDPDVLPGTTDVTAPDGPQGQPNAGFLWDAALRANLTVRNYGFYVDTTRYNFPQSSAYSVTLAHDPASTHLQTAFSANVALAPYTDPYFRGWDPTFPDYWRYTEWAREFDTRYVHGGQELPNLSLVRLMNDHTGNFSTAIDGVNTPELQQADNDYAVGQLVQKVSESKYANNTLIFVIEDDSQDGPDHVDSHRTVAFIAGAYVKRGAVVSTSYTTIDFLRTIEEVLGLPPMNLNDALAKPMADVFTTTATPWHFTAIPSAQLYNTSLPLPPRPAGLVVPRPLHDAAWWAEAAEGQDFESEDSMDFGVYNRITWAGVMGDVPYPATATGVDLSKDREVLLAKYGVSY